MAESSAESSAESQDQLPKRNLSNSITDEDSGPLLTYSLEPDDGPQEQLFSFRRASPPPAPKAYDPNRQQRLTEGELGESRFDARLRQVTFGTYRSHPACLLVLNVNFQPSNMKRWFRFRDATVDIEFDDDDEVAAEEAGKDNYQVPFVVKFYPEVIYGKVQTAMEQYGFEFSVPLPPPISGGGPSVSYSLARPREGAHLINGSMWGDPERRVMWKVSENETDKKGISPLCRLAVVVRLAGHRKFKMVANKATTIAGVAMVGKGAAPISFAPILWNSQGSMSAGQPMAGLQRGSLSVEQKTFVPQTLGPSIPRDLEQEDLEALTEMSKMLAA